MIKSGKAVGPAAAGRCSGDTSGGDTLLQNHSIVVERKHVTFDVRENLRGRFVRITEEVSGRRNAIIIPLAGIEIFRDVLGEIIRFSKTLSPKT